VSEIYTRGINLIKSSVYYYLYNAHGDVVQLADDNGEVTKDYRYDAFGVEIGKDENDANPWRYCGEYFDVETGTVYLRARSYSPRTGRFMTEDIVRELARELPNGTKADDPLSLNWYTYCHNNPITYFDPTGRSITITTLIFVGSIVIGSIAMIYTAYQSYKYVGRIDWVVSITQGISWFMLAYTLGMSAYSIYLSYCDYKGYTPITEVKFNDKNVVNTSFYVTPNGTAIPAETYKEWAGNNMRSQYLGSASNEQLKNLIDQMYRPNAWVGDGSTAAVLRFEQATGYMLSSSGHFQKATEMVTSLFRLIESGVLRGHDLNLAKEIYSDLLYALNGR
jgi:RHS repeat-associated protein